MRNANKWLYFLYLVVLIGTSSCYEIFEELAVKANGSGEMKLTFNASKSKYKLASAMLLDSAMGVKIPSKYAINTQFTQAVKELEQVKGVSNVTKTLDLDNYIATVKFSFNNMATLNQAIRQMMQEYKLAQYPPAVYKYSNGNFERLYTHSDASKRAYYKLSSEKKDLLNSGTYVSIFKMPVVITHHNGTGAKLSANKQALMQRYTVGALASGKTNPSIKIDLTK